MDKKREELVIEVLSAIKAEDVLERIRHYLDTCDEMVRKEDLMAIMQEGEEADEFYS